MEKNNKENREAEFKAKSWIVQPQTRLQKQAPAALQLDQMVIDGGDHKNSNYYTRSNKTPSCSAIPLLSPLILSPMHSQEGEEDQLIIRSVGCSGIVDETIITPPPSPALETFPDTSSLFSFFQAQCALANRVQ